jgi:hypothetical protein
MNFCTKCSKPLIRLEDDFFNKRYVCSSDTCRSEFSEKRDWVKVGGGLGLTVTCGKVVWNLATGNYVETAQTAYDVAKIVADALIDSNSTNV